MNINVYQYAHKADAAQLVERRADSPQIIGLTHLGSKTVLYCRFILDESIY